jgi:hypothetical protein
MFANTKVLAAIAVAGHPGSDYTCRTHQRRDIRGKGGAQESRAQATKRGHGKEASAAEKEEALLNSQCMFSLIMICEIHMFVTRLGTNPASQLGQIGLWLSVACFHLLAV